MDRIFKLPVGVAIFVALALAGMMGIFAFNPAQPAEAQSNSDATLSALTVSVGALDPGFAPNVIRYTATVDNNVASVTVTATPTNTSGARATINGMDATGSGASVMLDVGDNTVNVKVTSANGSMVERYIVVITRTGSDDDTLKVLSLWDGDDEVELDPDFVSSATSYTATAAVDNSVESVTVTATPTHEMAMAVVEAESGGNDIDVGDDGSVALTGGTSDTVTNITVTVTAEDGTTKGEYTIAVTRRTPSSDATLKSLKLSVGGFAETFEGSSTYAYTSTVASSVSSVMVTAETMNKYAVYQVLGGATKALQYGTNTITVVVTAENGTSTQNYGITVTRQTAMEDNHLASLSLTDDIGMAVELAPPFSPYMMTYTAMVADSVKKVTVMAAANASGAKAAITITAVAGASVDGDTNVVTLNPASGDGTAIMATVTPEKTGEPTKMYTVTLTNKAAGTDATLKSLMLSTGDLAPMFDKRDDGYEAEVAYSVESVMVTAMPTDSYAKVEGAGTVDLDMGENDVTIKVTAEDGTTVMRYFVTITRLSASATLSVLSLWNGTTEVMIDPAFMPSKTMGYTATVDSSVMSVTVTATPTPNMGGMAVVTYRMGTGSAMSTTNKVVPLAEGDTVITVKVTAENDTMLEYMITVTRDPSPDATLSDLTLWNGETEVMIDPDFMADTMAYNAMVDNSVMSVTVAATPAEGATFMVTGGDSLSVGANTITVTVTAQDGTTMMLYTVTVTRAATADPVSRFDEDGDGEIDTTEVRAAINDFLSANPTLDSADVKAVINKFLE